MNSSVLGQNQSIPVQFVISPETGEERHVEVIKPESWPELGLPKRFEVMISYESTSRSRYQSAFALEYSDAVEPVIAVEFIGVDELESAD